MPDRLKMLTDMKVGEAWHPHRWSRGWHKTRCSTSSPHPAKCGQALQDEGGEARNRTSPSQEAVWREWGRCCHGQRQPSLCPDSLAKWILVYSRAFIVSWLGLSKVTFYDKIAALLICTENLICVKSGQDYKTKMSCLFITLAGSGTWEDGA